MCMDIDKSDYDFNNALKLIKNEKMKKLNI